MSVPSGRGEVGMAKTKKMAKKGGGFTAPKSAGNIIIILCSIDSGNVDVRPTPLKESCHRSLWSLQITITLTESAYLTFFAIRGLKNCWHERTGIEPTTLNLSSQSGVYNLSAMARQNIYSDCPGFVDICLFVDN